MKFFMALVMALGAGLFIERLYRLLLDAERHPERAPEMDVYAARWVNLFLPLPLLVELGIYVFQAGWQLGLERFWLFSLRVLVMMSAYYALLLVFLPKLRQKFSAKACAMLWALPAMLWILCRVMTITDKRYALVLYIPEKLLPLLGGLCLGGAAMVMLVLVWNHLLFRVELLEDSEPEREEAVLALWETECKRMEWRGRIELWRCGAVKVPVAMGMFWGRRRVFLPRRAYTEAELRHIFRHEICHLMRHDPETKFVLSVVCALCWWNPLVWLVLRKSAEDTELACDEYVLSGAGEEDRRAYAELLLREAGDGRGFTSCLSAGAKSLRYRMKGALQKKKSGRGGVMLGVAMGLLVLMGNALAVSDQKGTAQELVFAQLEQPPAVCDGALVIDDYALSLEVWEAGTFRREEDPDSQQAYFFHHTELSVPVSAQTLFAALGNEICYFLPRDMTADTSDVYEQKWYLTLFLDEGGRSQLVLGERLLGIRREGQPWQEYRWAEPLDWALLESLLN